MVGPVLSVTVKVRESLRDPPQFSADQVLVTSQEQPGSSCVVSTFTPGAAPSQGEAATVYVGRMLPHSKVSPSSGSPDNIGGSQSHVGQEVPQIPAAQQPPVAQGTPSALESPSVQIPAWHDHVVQSFGSPHDMESSFSILQA